jgi:hypothetical protein
MSIWDSYQGLNLSNNMDAFSKLGSSLKDAGIGSGGLLNALGGTKLGGLLGDWMGKKFGNDPIRQESVEMDQNIDYSINASEVDKELASPPQDLYTGGESGEYYDDSGQLISYTSQDPEGLLEGSTLGVSGYPDGSDDLYRNVSGYPDGSDDLYRHETEETEDWLQPYYNPNQSIDTRYNWGG